MTTATRFLCSLVVALAFVSSVPRALALDDGPCAMEILVGGVPLPEYPTRSTTYVQALPDREYSVRLTNRTGSRIAVALSVDGLNSIDAKTTGVRDASKWILGPYESITIDGWQTSSATARRFFFTTESRSYGAWLGKTRNLGLIAAAVFREKLPAPRPFCYGRRDRDGKPCPPALYDRESGSSRDENRSRLQGAEEQGSESAPRANDEPASPEENAKRAESAEGSARAERFRKDDAASDLSDELAATGIGRELDHRVMRVRFDEEKEPATVMEIRYEYHDALVKLGVLPRCGYPRCEEPLARRERARGFVDDGYAPDPYRWRR